MKFQNRSIHGSKVNRRTDRQTDKPKAICPSNFFKVGGIITMLYMHLMTKNNFKIIISFLYLHFYLLSPLLNFKMYLKKICLIRGFRIIKMPNFLVLHHGKTQIG